MPKAKLPVACDCPGCLKALDRFEELVTELTEIDDVEMANVLAAMTRSLGCNIAAFVVCFNMLPEVFEEIFLDLARRTFAEAMDSPTAKAGLPGGTVQ